jgi:RNA polymerase subunit RPABC4/transcription elongation factor Spt4
MKTCTSCGHLINRGGVANPNNARCLVCRQKQVMKGWSVMKAKDILGKK